MSVRPTTAPFPPYSIDASVVARRSAERSRGKIREKFASAQQFAKNGEIDRAFAVFKRVKKKGLLDSPMDLPPAIGRVDAHFRQKYKKAFEQAHRYWGV